VARKPDSLPLTTGGCRAAHRIKRDHRRNTIGRRRGVRTVLTARRACESLQFAGERSDERVRPARERQPPQRVAWATQAVRSQPPSIRVPQDERLHVTAIACADELRPPAPELKLDVRAARVEVDRPRALDLVAGDPTGEVDEMRPEIVEDVVGDDIWAPRASVIAQLEVQVDALLTARQLPQAQEPGIESPVEPDPRRWNERRERGSLLRIGRGRLLDKDRQPRVRRDPRIADMRRGRRGDNHRIHIARGDKVIGTVMRRHPGSGDGAAGPRNVGDSREAYTMCDPRGRNVTALSEATAADKADPELAIHESATDNMTNIDASVPHSSERRPARPHVEVRKPAELAALILRHAGGRFFVVMLDNSVCRSGFTLARQPERARRKTTAVTLTGATAAASRARSRSPFRCTRTGSGGALDDEAPPCRASQDSMAMIHAHDAIRAAVPGGGFPAEA
jgi:hypothetical protein